MKLLLVEDNPLDARLLREILKDTPHASCQLEHVTRLDMALEGLRQQAFDLVLLDLGLPDSQGAESVRRINQAFPALPIIVLTGLANPEVALEAVQTGAQDYLVKGHFNAELLSRTIRYSIERKRASEELRQLNAVLERRVEERTTEFSESEERLALAIAGTHLGMFDLTLATGEAVATNQHLRLLGLRPPTSTAPVTSTALSQAHHYRQWAERVHPEDLPRLTAERNRCMAAHLPYETEYRVVWPDGSVHWLGMRAMFQYDARDQPQRLLGVCMDITERKRTEELLRFLGQRSVTGDGTDFFQALARYLANCLPMDFVCIDLLEEGHQTARTLAMFDQGQFQDNISYTLKDTPCGNVVGKIICCFPQDVRRLFPHDAVLQRMAAESYLGVTLWSSQCQPIGLIAVIGRQPLTDTRNAESIMHLVAVRAAVEIERMLAEQTLRQSRESALNLMQDAIIARQQAEVAKEELRTLNEELESRVLERTALLKDTVVALELEIFTRQRLEREILEISEREQCRLGQDLHDGLGQELAGTAMLGEVLAKKLQAESHPTAEAADKLTTYIRNTIESTRRIAKGLYPVDLTHCGLLVALKDLANQTTQRSGIHCELQGNDDLPQLDQAVEIHIYRIVQEAIGNAIKHGKPRKILIGSRAENGSHLFSVTDDGVGFVKSAGATGMGLHLMHYRARVIGARISIERPEQGGCQVICLLGG